MTMFPGALCVCECCVLACDNFVVVVVVRKNTPAGITLHGVQPRRSIGTRICRVVQPSLIDMFRLRYCAGGRATTMLTDAAASYQISKDPRPDAGSHDRQNCGRRPRNGCCMPRAVDLLACASHIRTWQQHGPSQNMLFHPCAAMFPL